MKNQNIKRNKDYSQVCIWPGVIVGKDRIEDFENFFLNDFNVRIQYLEEIKTKPDINNTDTKTNSRNDIFFAIHSEDISKFAIKRLTLGIMWIEDVLSKTNNYNLNPIYPERVFDYKTWDGEVIMNNETNE